DGTGAEEAYAKTAAELKVGEISKPVQTEYGIYLIKMIDDECTKTYEAAVDAAYEVERSEAFEAAYEVLLTEYPVEVNEEAWEPVLLGATVSLLE
ncbi:MAG: peptidylprolyl isomerase, partial [Lachnospiraceae bacterium]